LLGFVAVLALLWLLFAPGFSPVSTASPPPQAAALPQLELIRPGTEVGTTAPAGWTHLVLKSRPRLPEGERRLVSESTAGYAAMVFTTTAAAVVAEGRAGAPRYRLARIGLGVGLTIAGRDVVVSPDTQQRLGANLGLAGRLVLSGVYDKQREVRLVGASATGAVLDTPAFMPRGRGHAAVVLRYVFLVDPLTGRLDTLVWRIDLDRRGNYEGAVGAIEWLAPNALVDAVLKVDLNEFTLGVPSERAFAVTHIPEGQKQFAIPESLRGAAGAARLPADMARRLDGSLRALIAQAEARR
jgi:hypothetical protein